MDRNETIPPTTWVGIDVSKDTLDACLLPAPGGKARGRAFANDAAGHTALAELTATRFNPLVAALYDRLVAAGEPKRAAVGACMRKLLMIAYGVLKSRTPFGPAKGSKITPWQHTIWFGLPL